MKKSWKTTTAGIAAIIGAICSAIVAMFDNNPTTVPNWEAVWVAITAGIGLLSARDAKVSSEEEGIK